MPSARPSPSTSTPRSMDAAAERVSPRSTGTWPRPRKKAPIARPRAPGELKHSALAKQNTCRRAASRRQLDALVVDGLLIEREPRPAAQRGRGRPARTYALTDEGRASFPHGYDDLATTALRYLNETGGQDAVASFAAHRAKGLEQ